MKFLKKENKKEEKKIKHSNRGESLETEFKLEDSTKQWNDIKKLYEDQVNTIVLEQQILKREQEAAIERKTIFNEMKEQKFLIEENECNRILEIKEKINNKKKREIKRRDIAFRNRNILG